MFARSQSRQTAGTVIIGGLLLIFLLATRWSSFQELASDFAAPRDSMVGSFEDEDPAECDSLEDYAPEDWQMYTSMPVYVDLCDSLDSVTEARHRLIQQATDANVESLRQAASDYREAIRQVQTGFEKLRSRVPPDVFPDLAVELSSAFDAESGEAFLPWETDPAIAGAE